MCRRPISTLRHGPMPRRIEWVTARATPKVAPNATKRLRTAVSFAGPARYPARTTATVSRAAIPPPRSRSRGPAGVGAWPRRQTCSTSAQTRPAVAVQAAAASERVRRRRARRFVGSFIDAGASRGARPDAGTPCRRRYPPPRTGTHPLLRRGLGTPPGGAAALRRAVEHVREAVDDQGDPDDERNDRGHREDDRPHTQKSTAEQRVVLEDLSAPVRRRRLDADADEAEARDGEDGVCQAHDELDEDDGADIRQDLAEHDVRRSLRANPRGLDVLELALGQRGGPHAARDDRRQRNRDRDDDRRSRAPHRGEHRR